MQTMRLFVVALLAGTALSAAAAEAQTLNDALMQAYQTNPTLAAQRASQRATDETVAQANAAKRPSLSLSTALTSAYASGNTASLTTTGMGLTLSATQSLYRGGRIDAAIDQAEANVLAGRARLRGTEQTVLSSVVDAYMGVLRDQAVLQLNTNSEQVLATELAAARSRFQLGAATSTDVATAESRLSAAQAGRIQAEGNLRVSIASFEQRVGSPPGSMAMPNPPTMLPNSLDQAVDIGLMEHPTVVAAFYSELASQASVRSAEGALKPTVNASLSTTRRPQNWPDFSPATLTTTAGLNVSIPLYQQGAEYASIRSARESLAQSRLNLEDARRTIRSQVNQSWQQLATARAQILARGDQVRASEVALRGFRQEQEVGARTLLEVLNAEQDLLNARVQLVTSRRDEVVASYALLAAMGRLTAPTLELPVPIYDPTANYDRNAERWFGTK